MILVLGEALIDMLPAPVAGDYSFRAVPGGSPFNVALALGRLDSRVRFLCPISRDAFGQRLARALTESRVDLTGCPRTDAPSTLGFVSLDPATRAASYTFYTQGTAGCSLVPADLPAQLPDEIRALHVGSFSLAIEPFGSTVDALVAREAGRRFIAFDPNIRPFLIPDRDAYLRRWEGLVARADLVKLSIEDLAWLAPGVDPRAFLAKVLSAGPRLVVLTRGADGAMARSRHTAVEVPAPAGPIVDTVGAGDTFQAALLAGLDRLGRLNADTVDDLTAKQLHDLLAFAARAAAITCSREGCDPPWIGDLAS